MTHVDLIFRADSIICHTLYPSYIYKTKLSVDLSRVRCIRITFYVKDNNVMKEAGIKDSLSKANQS